MSIIPLIKLIPLTLVPLMSIPSKIKKINDPSLYIFSNDEIGPYDIFCGDVKIHFGYTPNSNEKYFEAVKGKSLDTNLSFGTTTITHSVSNGHIYEHYVSIPTSKYLSKSGMEVTYSVYNEKRTLIDSVSFIISSKSVGTTSNKVLVNDYLDLSVSYLIKTITIKNSKAYNKSETFEFSDSCLLENRIYYTLSIDSLYFVYTSEESFKCSNVYLLINDKFNIFATLDGVGNKKIVPLKYNVQDRVISFSFNNVMYVDTKTFFMSTTPRTGFLATTRFYLPINEKEKVEETEFQIVVEDAGASGIDLIWNLEYFSSKNLLGDCQNSDYCVVGGLLS